MRMPVAIAVLLCTFGCYLPSQYKVENHALGVPITATVGSPLITLERGMKDQFGNVMERHAKEFIYSGKAGQVVRFSYREFSGLQASPGMDAGLLARPAFTQDVQYDLAESDVIAFQNMRLKVINATNSDITVEVLRQLDPLPVLETPPEPQAPTPGTRVHF